MAAEADYFTIEERAEINILNSTLLYTLQQKMLKVTK